MSDKTLPEGLVDLLKENGIKIPQPGQQRWTFELEEPIPDGFSRELRKYGCRLNREYRIDGGRHYEYDVPSPGWPDPLGYITTESPRFVEPQITQRNGCFTGNVRGTIPDSGDCSRHPDLPEDAYALTRVSVLSPERFDSYSSVFYLGNIGEPRWQDTEIPEDKWVAKIQYEKSNTSYKSREEVYSSEIGKFPRVIIWKRAPHTRDKRTRYEFFDSKEQAMRFVHDVTGLPMSKYWKSEDNPTVQDDRE